MSHSFVQHDPKWQARREQIKGLQRDELEAALINAELKVNRLEIDLELATAMGRDVQKQLDECRKRMDASGAPGWGEARGEAGGQAKGEAIRS